MRGYSTMRRRRGQPGICQFLSYTAMRRVLRIMDEKKTWMTTDQILGAIQSGINEATAEFRITRKRRKLWQSKKKRNLYRHRT